MWRAAALVLLLLGCNDTKPQKASRAPEPPSPKPADESPPSEGEVLSPAAHTPKVKRRSELGAPLEWNTKPPVLDTEVTGVVTEDPHASELERCKSTAWSYAGCWVVYPTQGRIWTKFECEHVIDDDMRNLVCHNYASHLAVGDGGPPDRKRGLEILQIGCDAGVRTDCATIAAISMWDDPTIISRYVKKACDEDQRNSPFGLCQDIKAAMTKLQRYTVTVTKVEGLDGITTATKCSLGVIPQGDTCRVRFACGDRVLYGAFGGEAPCKVAGRGVAGGENMTSAKDDDPAIEFDAQAKTVRIHDDAKATAPAYDLRGSLGT
jgi:hypothetical protein